MPTCIVRGHSCGQICIEGGHLTNQFNGGDGLRYIHFNDGSVVEVGWCIVPTKEWHVKVVKLSLVTTAKALEPVLANGEHYSDLLQLDGPFSKVICWDSPENPTCDEAADFFTNFA